MYIGQRIFADEPRGQLRLSLSEGAVDGENGGGDAVPVVGREVVAAARGCDCVGGISDRIRGVALYT